VWEGLQASLRWMWLGLAWTLQGGCILLLTSVLVLTSCCWVSACSYLKEFRTEQCPLFVQHKCTQHRPYTCFHWHFVNQRRRRSIRRRDGTFNYSPDIYCTKYDETTGICPEGDE